MLRLGFVGLGQILDAHLRALAGLAGLRVTAVCDLRTERRTEVATSLGARPFGSIEALLDAGVTDAVVVALPHGLHCAATLTALDAGQHVVVEKPMAVAVDEVNRMLAAARRRGRHLLVAESAAAQPGAVATGTAFAAGDLGPFLTGSIVNARYYFHQGRPAWFLDPARSGGGMFANVGLHRLAVARTCLPGLTPVAVSASVVAHAQHPVEACTAALVRYDRGGAMLYQEVGYVPRPDWFAGGTQFVFAEGIVAWDGGTWRWQRRDGSEVTRPLLPDPGYRPVYEDLLRAAGGGAPTRFAAAGYGADVAIAQAAYASARDGLQIDLRQPPWRVDDA